MTTCVASVSVLLANLFEQLNRGAVRVRERRRRVSESRSPVGTGAPRRALENQAGAKPSGDVAIRPEVLQKRVTSLRILQQMERSEVRQFETVVKDQRRLDAAIGEKEVARELR